MLFRDQDNSSFSTKIKASASIEKSSLKQMLISSLISAPVIFSASNWAFAVSKSNELLEKKADASYCAPDLLAFPNHSKPDSSGLLPIVLEADDVTAEGEKKVILSGDSFVAQGRQSVNAETIIYDRENDKVQANGGVELRSVAGDLVTADSVALDINTLLGNAENAEYRLAKRGRITDKTNAVEVQSRGSADTVSMEGEDFVRLKNAEYTTCVEGQDDFFIKASELELDRATGIGTAKNARFVFFGVPFFYLPRVSFPITDDRKTGFLFPVVGNDSESGVFVGTPWYWNITENADATFTPKIFSKRGIQLGAEVRHMTENSETDFNAEILPSDDLFEDETRSYFAFDHVHDLTEKLKLNIDINDVSDTEYFQDFRTNINAFSATYAPTEAQLKYREDNWNLGLRAVTYQVIDDEASSDPYDLLPQLTFNNNYNDIAGLGLNYATSASLTNFSRDGEDSNTRILLKPSLERPFENTWSFIKPKLEIDFASYSQEDVDTRTAPIFSLDSGIFLEKRVSIADGNGLQTLEPRIFYVNANADSNDTTVSYDTSAIEYNNFNDLFSTTGFTGGDNVADGQRVTFALTSRLYDGDGDQRLKAQIGQAYFIDDVVTTNAAGETVTQEKSDILLDFDIQLTKHLNTGAFFGYGDIDGTGDDIRNANFNLDYQSTEDNYFKFSYRLNKDLDSVETESEDGEIITDSFVSENSQFVANASFKVSPQWRLFGTQRYDLDESESINTRLGAEYDACCWSLTLTADRLRKSEDETVNSIFAQIEFSGLGKIKTGFQ